MLETGNNGRVRSGVDGFHWMEGLGLSLLAFTQEWTGTASTD